ncbi:unnamed protein product [Caenorhabditis sp. 36 PRJEB53466]|nr:unnamed protein product [Caenorhabditis sp. 36 PRJEB53466]
MATSPRDHPLITDKLALSKLRRYIRILKSVTDPIDGDVYEGMTGEIVELALESYTKTVEKRREMRRRRNASEVKTEEEEPVKREETPPTPPSELTIGSLLRRRMITAPVRHRFTFVGLEFGLGWRRDRHTAAEILTEIGINTSTFDVCIPYGCNPTSYSQSDFLGRATFEVDDDRAVALLDLFDGDECDLKKHSNADANIIRQKTTLSKELSEWEFLKSTTIRLATKFFPEMSSAFGHTFEFTKDSVTFWKAGKPIVMLTLDDLIQKHPQVFEKAVQCLTEIGKTEMLSYAHDLSDEEPEEGLHFID